MQPLLQWKTKSITQCQCVFVALGIHHAMRMHHILSVSCPALQHFPTLSHKRNDFREKEKLLNTKCVFRFSLQLLSESFLILSLNLLTTTIVAPPSNASKWQMGFNL